MISNLFLSDKSTYFPIHFFSSSIGMEDAHATVLNLDERTGDEKASVFAVYDGHGGE